MNQLGKHVRLVIAILSLFVMASPSLGERLGVCGLDSSASSCESKSLQVFRVAQRVVANALITCGQLSSMGHTDCLDDVWEEDLTLEIGEAIQSKLENIQIEFKSERANPGFFMLDGQVRIAKTGSNPGDVIFINRDMAEAYSTEIYDAVVVLTHELGHHFGAKDHQRLDRLGARVKEYLNKFQLSSAEVYPENPGADQQVEVWVFNLWNLMIGAPMFPVDGHSVIILWDGHDFIDLTQEWLPKICESGTKLTTFSAKSIEFVLSNPNSLVLAAPLSYYCMPENGFGRLHIDTNGYITLPVKKNNDNLMIDAGAISWELKKCSQDTVLGCKP